MLGRVPARLKTRVIITRSMLVLLNADEMVKPPIRSMIVGENMMEKTYLRGDDVTRLGFSSMTANRTYFVASGVDIGIPSLSRMTRSSTSSKGTNIEVTNKGMACSNLLLATKLVSKVYEFTRLSCPKDGAERQDSEASIRFSFFHNRNIQQGDKHQQCNKLKNALLRNLEFADGGGNVDNARLRRLQENGTSWMTYIPFTAPLSSYHLPPYGVSFPSNILPLVKA